MSSTGVMTRGLVLKRSCALCTVYGRSIRASAGRFRVTFKITVDAMYTPCFPICTYIPRFVYDFETGFSLAVSLLQPSVAGDEIAANTR